MKFKLILESEMINELSNDGKWVTFKNGQHTYIGKGGEIETGTLLLRESTNNFKTRLKRRRNRNKKLRVVKSIILLRKAQRKS